MKQFSKLLIIILFLTMAQIFLLRFINPPCTAIMAWSWIQHKFTSKKYKRPNYHWQQLKEISPWLIKAVLAGEDQRFSSHHGFDFIEMNQAIRDIIMDRRVRGASTITMQVARTVFLWPDRNWMRKTAEAYYTVLIEIFWPKTRILEIYLNFVDWGSGIMGAEAASQKYFHTNSARINPSQAALMAAILPSPHKWSPTNPNEFVKERQKRIMKDMEKMHL
ncbi:MAG: monofunctional biosynthetic peptidoglycan transglycosylase [Deltaproteobacteria bacterium]|nr:monofunctional biosynthetic peptidoglycan transglycosylase [Deltaproteobacteria bacterium]